jgi:hypothetical protein
MAIGRPLHAGIEHSFVVQVISFEEVCLHRSRVAGPAVGVISEVAPAEMGRGHCQQNIAEQENSGIGFASKGLWLESECL